MWRCRNTKATLLCGRSLYKLFKKQIELGHLYLPRELTGKLSGKQPIAEVKVDSDLVARLAHQGRLVSTIETKCISKEYLRDISRSTWSIANPGRDTAYLLVSIMPLWPSDFPYQQMLSSLQKVQDTLIMIHITSLPVKQTMHGARLKWPRW